MRVQISDNLNNKNCCSCEDSTSDSSSGNLCDIQCKRSAKIPMENQDMKIEEASTSHPTSSATDEGSNITVSIKLKMDVGINRGIDTVINIKSAKNIAEDLNEDLDEGMMKSKKVESEKESSCSSLPDIFLNQSLPSPKLKYKELSHLPDEKESRSQPTSSTAIPFATFVQNPWYSKSKFEKFTKPDMSTIKKNYFNCEDSTSDSSSGNSCDIQCQQSAKRPMENRDMEVEEASTSHPISFATDGGSNITQPIKLKMDVGINRGIDTVTNIKSGKKIAQDLNEDLDEGMMKSKKVESEKESSCSSLPDIFLCQSLPSPKLKYKELSHLPDEKESRSQPTSSTAIPPATFVQNPQCPKSKPEKFTKPDMSTIEKDSMNPSPSTANGGSISSNVTNGKNYDLDYDSDYHEIKEPTREKTSPNILAQSFLSTSKAGNNLVIPDKAYVRQRQFSAANESSKMYVEKSKGSLDSNQKNNISSDRKDISSNRRGNISSDRRDNVSLDRRDNIRSFGSNYLSKMSCCKRLMFLPLTVIVVFSIAVYMSESRDRKHSSDFASSVVELKKRIHGQNEIFGQNATKMFDLSEYLLSDTPRLKMITLIGGTGVGKSYTVEIIKKNFPRKYSICQYFPPIRTGFEFNISFLQPGLIIIENLKERDFMDVAKFLKNYQDTYKDKLMTILAVFNFEDIDDSKKNVTIEYSCNQCCTECKKLRKMKNIFIKGEGINIRPFYYFPLDDNALSMCIMDAMVESGLKLSENEFAAVKQSLIQNNAGCKGAYNLVQKYGRQ